MDPLSIFLYSAVIINELAPLLADIRDFIVAKTVTFNSKPQNPVHRANPVRVVCKLGASASRALFPSLAVSRAPIEPNEWCPDPDGDY